MIAAITQTQIMLTKLWLQCPGKRNLFKMIWQIDLKEGERLTKKSEQLAYSWQKINETSFAVKQRLTKNQDVKEFYSLLSKIDCFTQHQNSSRNIFFKLTRPNIKDR